MTDEARPETGTTEETPAAGAGEQQAGVATAEEQAAEEKKPEKLHQNVDIRDVGPCKKYIKVSIERADIDKRMDEHFKELVADSQVAGFRPGKAPKDLVRRRFAKDVTDQVK